MLRRQAVMGGGGAEADVIRIGDAAGEREQIAVAERVRPLLRRDEQILPQLARSSQPLRRSDSITWSAALGLPPSSWTISARVASRRRRSVSARTTLLSCADNDRVIGSMSFSVTKPPE